MQHRFGALGKHGSLAVIERSIRTVKTECTRRLMLVPFCLAAFQHELALYFFWYNGYRPHSRLGGATPDEVYHRQRRACRAPHLEPRPRWPRRSPCAAPQALIRGQPGAKLDLSVRFHAERRHLPIVTLKRAA
ncbi:MAG TPA: integrase core domain-containing protein [Candidatus Polarisedimenticolia bacterium]|nr:integrase core domain-containing protein [Candidatus Polarisedimenticolia bacterium]